MCAKIRTKTANGNQGSKWITKTNRLAIYLRDRFTCLYCLRDLHDAHFSDVTLDHVRPGHGGEADKAGNLITACRSCNSAKQDKPLARFAGPETRKHIYRNIKRNMTSYTKLAKAIINGTCGDPRLENR